MAKFVSQATNCCKTGLRSRLFTNIGCGSVWASCSGLDQVWVVCLGQAHLGLLKLQVREVCLAQCLPEGVAAMVALADAQLAPWLLQGIAYACVGGAAKDFACLFRSGP